MKAGKQCAWRLRKGVLEYATADGFGPVFSLMATGKGGERDVSMSYDESGLSAGAQGIKKHLDAILGKRSIKLAKVTAAPKHTGKVVHVSLDRAKVREALAGKFALPAASNPVADLRVETATDKSSGAKDYEKGAGTRTLPRLYMAAVYTILGNQKKIPQGSKPDREGVVAIIADGRGNIMSWGLKNQDVDCWHGETISVIRLGGTLPAGGVVFSSLKPCHMCSGVLLGAGGGKCKVYWG